MTAQGRHLGGVGSTDLPRIYDFNLFPENRTSETVIPLQEKYFMQTKGALHQPYLNLSTCLTTALSKKALHQHHLSRPACLNVT